jgi:citrate lyase subunit beta/citryl-CoA lyase
MGGQVGDGTGGRAARSRRTVHVVPGSSERFLAKIAELDADQVVLDLEDAVAPGEKERARALVVTSLRELELPGKTLSVRVNATDSAHCHRDIVAVVEGAGEQLATIVLPKARTAADIAFADMLLGQVELGAGLAPGSIGIDAQIEDASGVVHCEAIAAASPRMEALHFGPGDFSAAVGIPTTTIGGVPDGYPGDHLNHVYWRIVLAARTAGIQAIDGPYGDLRDADGLRERARLVRALGLDGKWTIHPSQIPVVNEIFTPTDDELERAEALLAAYAQAAEGEGRGAALFGGEMVDEASRKMAERIVRSGRAAGRSGRVESADGR